MVECPFMFIGIGDWTWGLCRAISPVRFLICILRSILQLQVWASTPGLSVCLFLLCSSGRFSPLLCSPGWSWTCKDPLASPSGLLGLQTGAANLGYIHSSPFFILSLLIPTAASSSRAFQFTGLLLAGTSSYPRERRLPLGTKEGQGWIQGPN